jgi:hypothetical protein
MNAVKQGKNNMIGQLKYGLRNASLVGLAVLTMAACGSKPCGLTSTGDQAPGLIPTIRSGLDRLVEKYSERLTKGGKNVN